MSMLQENDPYMKDMKQVETAALFRQIIRIMEELRQGVKKPYKEVIDVASGDPQKTGMKPLSFVRQILAACLYPQLINDNKLPVDVRQRAQRLLGECPGGSVGSYSATRGMPDIVHRVSEYISRRDGGAWSNPENIYISPGSQWSLANIFQILVNTEASTRTGILTPVPGYNTSILSIKELGAVPVPYYLDEEQGWELHMEELHRALASAKGVCNPVALYIINPGNPSGQVQSRQSIQEVIQFASEKRLFILADEVVLSKDYYLSKHKRQSTQIQQVNTWTYVCNFLKVYQDTVYGEKSEFVSYKRVLAEMGPPFSDTVELASFHSASKGMLGECGLRCGYVELVNLDPAVMKYIYTQFSKDSCAPVLGQIALDVMANPPQPGDPSYPFYIEETQHIRTTLVHNVNRALTAFNSLPGLTCQPGEGGVFVFPRLDLPPRAIQKAKEAGLGPDTFYCVNLLEDAGVFARPGAEYGQKEGTHHIRICIMTPPDIMEELLRRVTSFHTQLMKDFS